jgi:hypothetical protein
MLIMIMKNFCLISYKEDKDLTLPIILGKDLNGLIKSYMTWINNLMRYLQVKQEVEILH